MKWRERIYCGELGPSHAGSDVLLMGWVDAIRDHGNVLFIHLRDIRGIVQVVFSPEKDKNTYENATRLREEYVVEITGRVALREKGTENPYLDTGNIEVIADSLKVFSGSKSLPFQITEKAMVFGEELQSSPENVDEELRLKYRYLDLRRPSMREIFVKRYRILNCVREYLDQLNFVEVETPFLTRSTPEGARDYLVPSRVHQGKFYALPQSPQLFKQLLMVGGLDRYFQIARCFRDEDLRPNRQPEFTQLDLEASFIDEEFIHEIIEELTVRIFSLGGISLPRPFPRMTYETAMERYGTDRPDLRVDMIFEEVADILRDTDYTIFRQIIEKGGLIKGFCIKDQADSLSKNILQNEYAMKIVPSFGAKGMSWMKVTEGQLQSNIVQFFSPTEQQKIMERFKAEEGDVIMMIADTSREMANKVLCSLRLHVAERLGLLTEEGFYPLWVTDFPLFELKDGKPSSQHHPFTMPDRIDFDPDDTKDLLSLNSRAYDLVVNGEELGGGSIRIHDMGLQRKIFKALGLSQQEAEAKFGFFLKALEFGAPPHGGLALGIDRVIAMILKRSSIRDVIAFPKNRRAFCPLTHAPSFSEKSQLDELGLDAGSSAVKYMKRPGNTDWEGSGDNDLKKTEKISEDEVNHVAKLARLKLSDSEAELYRKDLNSILSYVDSLEELDTNGVTPMSHVLDIWNVWREDTPSDKEAPDELLSNAPEREKGYFKVPKILEG
ncbi:aspartate--tRNA ligase [Thermodesulfobacteriota bacterium]